MCQTFKIYYNRLGKKKLQPIQKKKRKKKEKEKEKEESENVEGIQIS